MIHNLIFDLDGTLLNTLADLRDSTNYALQQFGFPERSTEEVRNFVGNGLRMLIRRAVPFETEEETVDAVLAVMKAHYREHYHDGTIPYDGILPFLHKMKMCGFRMAIVSNKADPMVQLLRTLYFDELIPVAVGELDGVPVSPRRIWCALPWSVSAVRRNIRSISVIRRLTSRRQKMRDFPAYPLVGASAPGRISAMPARKRFTAPLLNCMTL